MALRTIIKRGDSILAKKSREVVKFDDRLHILIDDMIETMREANGVGLAAVQVGVLRQVIIVEVGEQLIELVNPKIIDRSDEDQCGLEGCLSFPGEEEMVIRPMEVTVEAQDRQGNPVQYTGEGLLARAFCHELDHLDGIVFHDVAATPEELEEWEEVVVELDDEGNEILTDEDPVGVVLGELEIEL